MQNPEELNVTVRDPAQAGRPARRPAAGADQRQLARCSRRARESAVRALFRSQPFDMLRPEHYELWKEIEITFDPRDMFRG